MDIIFRKDSSMDWEIEGEYKGVINKALVHYKGQFYLVSENTALSETLIFYSNPTGEIKNYTEVGGGRGVTLEDVLNNFNAHLYEDLYQHLS